MVTFAPVTTAPEESTTVPDRLPRTDDSADPWAKAGTVKAVSRASTAKPTTNFLAICATPCVVNFVCFVSRTRFLDLLRLLQSTAHFACFWVNGIQPC